MRIVVEQADGTQQAPLILIDLDDGKGLVPLQQVFQRIFTKLNHLRSLVHPTHPASQPPEKHR